MPRSLEKCGSLIPLHIISNRFTLSNYEKVFAGLDGNYGFGAAHSVFPGESPDECDESLTEGDIDRALLGIDNIDPSTFWNFPGTPKELREIAQQRERDTIEDRIFKWSDDCYVGEEEDEYDPKVFLNIKDIPFSEELCSQD